jgi:endonuclease/exonuclease/phosphatase family metal-dependent hydrolase
MHLHCPRRGVFAQTLIWTKGMGTARGRAVGSRALLLLSVCAGLLAAVGCSDAPPDRSDRPDLQLVSVDATPTTEDTSTSTTEDTPTSTTEDTPTSEDSSPPTDEGGDGDATSSLPPGLWIATYNVERFFDTVCDSGQCGPAEYEPLVDAQAFEKDADRVFYSVRALGADIVLLQEIESEACVEALRQRLGAEYDVITLGETNLPASVDVAVALRGELVKTVTHRQEILPRPDGGTTRFAREFYEVHALIQGQPVIVFAAHFISKVGGDDSRRLAEATAARRIVLDVAQKNPQALVVMGGDLNDTPGSPPIDTLTQDPQLLRVAAELGDADGTYLYNNTYQALDHLIIAVAATGGAYVPGTVEVMREPTKRGWGGSDHSALRAYFSLTALASSP